VSGLDFNVEENLHPDIVTERFDAAEELMERDAGLIELGRLVRKAIYGESA
jgi:hypothetical protein